MKSLLPEGVTRPEVALALVLIGIVAVLVLPLGRFMLDLLTVLSLSSCLLVLLMAVRVQSPVQLLTFPGLLLITTMLRLSLNVASTKMILLEGKAGHVVETFGRVVMGQNLLVGLSAFAIVSIVQFLVVAKGADRVAEVAARFTLDAMPGKQMSIDAEMRGGVLTPLQASQRRERLDIESRFFGGMDGAMKFVKGDAIAGLVIALVNILAGLGSGMAYHGMSASDALARYATLSIGDAMVSQLPSFMIAVAAGLVTTRVTASNASGLDLGGQILADLRQHPVALILVGTFCLGLAPLAGIPAVPFIALGAVAVAAGTAIRRTERRSRISPVGFRHPMPSFTAPGAAAPPVFIDEQQPPFDAPIVVLLSRELAERIDAVRLDSLVAAAADRLAQAWGAPYPGLRCGLLRADTAAAEPPPLQLRWLLNGTEVCRLAWRDDQQLRLGLPEPHADGPLKLLGFPDAEWIAPDGQAAPDLLEQLVAGVTEHLCLREPARTLTHEQFHVLMTSLKRDYPQLAEGLAATIPLPVLTDVARCLLREGLSLRSLPPMCDLLLSQSPLPQDANSIAEVVVTGWSRRRCADAAPDGTLRAHLVDPLIEDVMQGYAAAARDGTAPGSSVPDADAFREVRQLMSDMAARHPRGRINLLCRGPARVLVSEIAAMASSRFRVFSFRGVNPRFDIEILSRLTLSAASAERLAADRQNWDEPIARPAFQDNFGDGADGGTGFPDDFAPDEHQPGFMQ